MATVLTAGALVGCRTQQPTQQPSASFLSEIVSMLGKNGQACFDRGADELCIAKTTRPIAVGDTLEPAQELVLCTRVAGQLGDCHDVRAEPELGVDYICDQGTCYCEGVASCTLMAADCGGGGTCGTCAIGDCCCPESAIQEPRFGVFPLDVMP